MALLNQKFNLKFTMQHDIKSITFLDMQIFKQTDSLIKTTLYHKSTAGNTIPHTGSAHPQPVIRSMPYSQYLCLHRIFSSNAHFKQEADAIRDILLVMGCSRTLLWKINTINKLYKQNRVDLLFKTKNKAKSNTVWFITTYTWQHQQFHKILR